MSLICPKCSKENTDKAIFCSNCGETLDKDKDFNRYDSIGGWLYVVGIGIVLSPIWSLANIGAFNDMKSNENLVTSYPNVISLINNGLLVHYLQLAIAIIMIYLFFWKKSIFPEAFIGWLIFNIALVVINNYIDSSIFYDYPQVIQEINSESIKDFFKSLIRALVWIPYMLISKRVKGTFIK
jgi:predicted nucleic acid-binding Zn ribbon protein